MQTLGFCSVEAGNPDMSKGHSIGNRMWRPQRDVKPLAVPKLITRKLLLWASSTYNAAVPIRLTIQNYLHKRDVSKI